MSTGLAAAYFVVSLIATLYAAAVFAERLDHLGARLGLPEALLGLLTAAGADAPELASAIAAIASGAKGVGFGVVVGSNVFNLAAMLGLSAVVAGTVSLHRDALALEGGVALAATGVVALLGFGVLPAWATVMLVAAVLLPYVLVVARGGRRSPVLGEPHRRLPQHGRALWKPLLVIPPAVAAIVLGSIGMVHAALRLGDAAGLPQVLVGTLLLAVLTSLPNAYTGVRLGRAGRGSALVAETMNSNTINLVGGIAVPALFVAVGSDLSGLERADVVWMLVATAATIALLARRPGLGRAGGIALVVAWVAFAAVQGAAGAARGPVPPKLAGVWGARLVNYPDVGLYKGYYRLKFGPGSQMHYLPAHEAPVAQAVSVAGSRITFMRSGVCTTPGTYVWRVSRKTLTLTKVSDACRKRAVQLARAWTRVGR